MRLVYSWLSNIVAIFAASALIPAVDYGDDFGILVLAGLVFGLANVFVRPLVIVLALPAVLLSLGLALLFINALMLYLTSVIVAPFEVGGFWSAVGGALIIWLVNVLLGAVLRPGRARPERPRPSGL